MQKMTIRQTTAPTTSETLLKGLPAEARKFPNPVLADEFEEYLSDNGGRNLINCSFSNPYTVQVWFYLGGKRRRLAQYPASRVFMAALVADCVMLKSWNLFRRSAGADAPPENRLNYRLCDVESALVDPDFGPAFDAWFATLQSVAESQGWQVSRRCEYGPKSSRSGCQSSPQARDTIASLKEQLAEMANRLSAVEASVARLCQPQPIAIPYPGTRPLPGEIEYSTPPQPVFPHHGICGPDLVVSTMCRDDQTAT